MENSTVKTKLRRKLIIKRKVVPTASHRDERTMITPRKRIRIIKHKKLLENINSTTIDNSVTTTIKTQSKESQFETINIMSDAITPTQYIDESKLKDDTATNTSSPFTTPKTQETNVKKPRKRKRPKQRRPKKIMETNFIATPALTTTSVITTTSLTTSIRTRTYTLVVDRVMGTEHEIQVTSTFERLQTLTLPVTLTITKTVLPTVSTYLS